MKENTPVIHQIVNIAILTIVSIVFLLVFSFNSSPLYANDGMDSVLFKTIGRAILDGRIPYRDVFDHKGPFLFYINAFGELIAGHGLGVFILQVVNLTVTLWLLCKTSLLFISRRGTLFILSLFVLLLCGMLSEGNGCEEWMLPYIMLSLYLSAKTIKKGKQSRLTSVVIGICFALVFLIRPNDGVSSVGACFAGLIIFGLIRKEWLTCIVQCCFFTLGFLAIMLPTSIYFAANGAFTDMLYGLIGFNMKYTEGVKGLITACFSAKYFMLLTTLATIVALVKSENKMMLCLLCPIMVCQWVLTGSNMLVHYFIITVPVLCLATAVLMTSYRNGAIAIWTAMLLMPNFTFIRSRTRNAAKCLFRNGNEIIDNYYRSTENVLQAIPPEDKDSVWNYNLAYIDGRAYDPSALSIFYHYDIVPCNRIILWWHYCFDSKFSDPESITLHNPKWVVVDMQSEYLPDITYIEEHYSVYAQSDTSICDIRLFGPKREE